MILIQITDPSGHVETMAVSPQAYAALERITTRNGWLCTIVAGSNGITNHARKSEFGEPT